MKILNTCKYMQYVITCCCNKCCSIFLIKLLSILYLLHSNVQCSRYLRLKVPEVDGMIITSSVRRMAAICKHPPAECCQDVIDILSDQTDNEFRVYQEIGSDDRIKTIATGMFLEIRL